MAQRAEQNVMPESYKASYSTGIYGGYQLNDLTVEEKKDEDPEITMMNKEIKKFDDELGGYYGKNRSDYYNDDKIGQFKLFVEENGHDEPDQWNDEMEYLDGEFTEDCLLIQFFEDYPKGETMDTEDAFNLLKKIKNLSPGDKLDTNENQLRVNMFDRTTPQDVDVTTERYANQMPLFVAVAERDLELKWFLAASELIGYPFLTYMVDSYTNDRAKTNFESGKPLKLLNWLLQGSFYKKLRDKNQKNADKLKQAMESYSNRLLPRLQVASPTVKIHDDLKEVAEYIVAIAKFIKNLIDNNKTAVAVPPFQVDLLIAVNRVSKSVKDDDEKEQNDDDDSDYDEQDKQNEEKFEDPNKDYIGHVQDKLKKYGLCYHPKDNYDRQADIKEHVDGLARELRDKYKDFRTVLDDKCNNKKKSDNNNTDDAKEPLITTFNAKTYPQHRRFSVFVDRREEKPTNENKNDTEENKDQITFFQTPDGYSTMQKDFVYEVGFEFLRQCLIPEMKDDKEKNISAKDSLCGQLLTFMFNVQALDETQCYIIWNGQSMRFQYQHITQVLPYLFAENKQNKKFSNKGGEGDILKETYNNYVSDKRFSDFYKRLSEFN